MDYSIRSIKKKFQNLKRSKYGSYWQKERIANNEWYETLFSRTPLIHEDFTAFLRERRQNVKSVLEIGCGTGIYPIKFKTLFEGMEYTGLDIGQPAIDYCKKHSSFNFICGDFLKIQLPPTFDLIFSHAVIDHVYDINGFMSKVTRSCDKYAYVSAYRGYFPDLSTHKMTWNNEDGCYYNDLSVNEARKTLIESGLRDDEFTIRKQASGVQLGQPYSVGLDGFEAVIEINKKPKNSGA